MRYQFSAFLVALRMQLRSWKTWILLLLLPGVTWILSAALPAQAVVSPVQVGVCLPAEGAEEFWQRLDAKSGTVTTFVKADRQTIIGKVSTGQWDCGIALAEDFAQRAEQMDTKKIVTLYIGEASAVYPVVREIVSACLIDVMGEGIAEEYLQEEGFVQTHLKVEPLPAQERVEVKLSTVDGRQLDALELSADTSGRVIKGVLGIILTIWMCLAAVDLGRWLEQPGVQRFAPLRTMTQRLLPQIAASVLPVLCSAGLSVWLCGGNGQALLAMGAYLLTMCAWLPILARLRAVWSAMPVLMPFVPVICLVFSPVILDLSVLVPAIGPVAERMPLTLYLYAAEGNGLCMLRLLLTALIGMLLSVLWDHAAKGRGRIASEERVLS